MIGLRDESDSLPPPPSPALAPVLTGQLFAEDGWLQTLLKLEHRPQQERMARAVAAAMVADKPLLFEAGTGVGKSLAYLLPGLIQARDQGRQMIVSTHTIALQEQLDRKDLPLCRRVLAAVPETRPYAEFKSAVLLGKGNYLCTSRLAAALRDKEQLFATVEHGELQRIAAWAEVSADGLRHELQPPPAMEVWEMVCAESSGCGRKYCDPERCFYQRARARLRAAQVIIVNHSLLFAQLNSAASGLSQRGRGVLFPDDFVVLDEAHTVPGVATDYFGLRLSSYGVDRMLKYLYNPKTRRGLLQKLGDATDRQRVTEAIEAAQHFFAALDEHLLARQAIVRVREEGCAEPWLDAPLEALHLAVRTRADSYDDGREREELLEQAGRVQSCRTQLRQFLALAEADKFVYWVERTGKRQSIVNLRTAPINVAPYLRELLLERETSVVFTSATLAVGGSLAPFQARVGAEKVRSALEHSPFDFARCMRVFVATDVPAPTAQEARLALDVLADYIDFCTQRTQGGSLVLFTSFADLRHIADVLEPIYAAAGRPFWMQGRDLSRTELARRLQEAGNGILFGTDSFWTGIDVPGDALAQVILTRLPFEVPTHPVLEARTEHIRARGGQPFQELTLPDALMQFRQGVGRLIRSASDRGVITLLDSRLVHKSYGRLFLDTLPQRQQVRMTRQNRAEKFQPFV